jgi:hypothetical protein
VCVCVRDLFDTSVIQYTVLVFNTPNLETSISCELLLLSYLLGT